MCVLRCDHPRYVPDECCPLCDGKAELFTVTMHMVVSYRMTQMHVGQIKISAIRAFIKFFQKHYDQQLDLLFFSV